MDRSCINFFCIIYLFTSYLELMWTILYFLLYWYLIIFFLSMFGWAKCIILCFVEFDNTPKLERWRFNHGKSEWWEYAKWKCFFCLSLLMLVKVPRYFFFFLHFVFIFLKMSFAAYVLIIFRFTSIYYCISKEWCYIVCNNDSCFFFFIKVTFKCNIYIFCKISTR